MAILVCVSLEATQRGIGGKWRKCLAMRSAVEAAIKSALKEIDSGDGNSPSSCLYLELRDDSCRCRTRFHSISASFVDKLQNDTKYIFFFFLTVAKNEIHNNYEMCIALR